MTKKNIGRKGDLQMTLLIVFFVLVLVAVFLTQFAFSSEPDFLEKDDVLKTSIVSPLEEGVLPVFLQDQSSEVVDLYMVSDKVSLSLVSPTQVDDYNITVNSTTGVVVGDVVCLKENGRYTQVKVRSISGSVLVLDTPLDYSYSTSAEVHGAEHDMSVVGSVSNPVVYHVEPPSGAVWDVTRLIVHIEDETAMDGGTFGGIPALSNGVVLRVRDGYTKNVFNVKTNSEFRERAYDVAYDDKAPAGVYGVTVRRSFGGQEKNGVVIRLDGSRGDQLQMIIRDNLSGLSHFHLVVQGHVVVDT